MLSGGAIVSDYAEKVNEFGDKRGEPELNATREEEEEEEDDDDEENCRVTRVGELGKR